MNAMMSALFVDATRAQTARRAERYHKTAAASRRSRRTARRVR